jgi:hypothetical protein
LHFCRWQKLQFFSKHCHFLSFWCNFPKNSKKDPKILRKMTEKWQQNDKKMTMLREKCNFCHLQKVHFFCRLFVIFCHFFVIFLKIVKKSKNSSENDRKMTTKWQKNDNASRKMQFLPPAKSGFFLSFVCHFVILWKICHFFGHVGAILSKRVKKIEKFFEKWQKNDRKNLNDKKKDKKMTKKWQTKLKWQKTRQKMTKKITDKTEMTKQTTKKWQKKMTDKTEMTKTATKKNDRQNWNDKKTTKNDNIFFYFFNLCLPKFLLNLDNSMKTGGNSRDWHFPWVTTC